MENGYRFINKTGLTKNVEFLEVPYTLYTIANYQKLTPRREDYSKWYNELVVKADLAEQSAVRGCMVIKPYGYAIWVTVR